jgi:prepilin peptidase CpaA
MFSFLTDPRLYSYGLIALMIAVMLWDLRDYIIPNLLNVAIVVLYVPAALMLPIDSGMAVVAACIALAVGLGLFALNIMGGGDIKLLVALTLWTGWSKATLDFLLLTVLIGGALALVVWVLRPIVSRLWRRLCPSRNLPKIFTYRQPIPYGLAIAGAFLLVLSRGQVPGL